MGHIVEEMEHMGQEMLGGIQHMLPKHRVVVHRPPVRMAGPMGPHAEIVRHIPGGEIIERRGVAPNGDIVETVREDEPNMHAVRTIRRGPNGYSMSSGSSSSTVEII